tara:strand:- start:1914 stop:2207 length:294 start_codon:yes stop_codon:yes gene_type:complete
MFDASFQLPKEPIVEVKTTNNRGFTPEEIAKRCAEKIICISDKANPVIQEQAKAFKNQIEQVLVLYMREAINSDRTTIYNALSNAGHEDLAKLIRRL